MKSKKLLLLFLLFFIVANGQKRDSSLNKLIDQQDEKYRNIENKLETYQNQLYNETIRKYQETNDRINSQTSFLGVIATIFGVIIAIGSILIGFESIRSNRKRDEAIRTLEEAKAYVEKRKVDFDGELGIVKVHFENEYKKVVALFKEQLIKEIDVETNKVKDLATKKYEEIESFSIQKGNDEAIESLNRRLKFFESVGIPDDPKILLSKAKLLGENEMHNEAIEILEKIIENKQQNEDTYWRLGWEYNVIGKIEDSIENYLKSIEINSKNSSAFNNLAVEYQKLEKFYDALKNYEKAISLDPNKKLYYINKARVLKKLNSFDEALSVYKKNIELFPEDIDVYNDLIHEYKDQNHDDQVLRTYDLAIEKFPDLAQELNGKKAFFLGSKQKFPEAIQILNSLIATGYKVESCFDLLSDFYDLQGDIESALDSITKALELNKLNALFVTKKSKLLYKQNKEMAFEYSLNTGKELNSERALEGCAKLFAKNKDFEKSKALYNAALEIIHTKINDNNENDILNCYEIYTILGEYKKGEDFIKEKKGYIKISSKKNVLNFLLYINGILYHKNAIVKSDLVNFNKVTVTDKLIWNYDDILFSLIEKIDEPTYKTFSSLVDYLQDKITMDEFEKKIDDILG